jgi:hypothetical protein
MIIVIFGIQLSEDDRGRPTITSSGSAEAFALTDLYDVTILAPTAGDFLMKSGEGDWVNVATPFAAADHVHIAGDIASGTFEAGNYTFPDDVWIYNLFNINAIIVSGTIQVMDDRSVWFGSNQDSRLFWDNASEILKLKIDNWDSSLHIIPTESAGEHLAAVFAPQAQELYFDAVKKFETTDSGVSVIGTLSETSQHTHTGYVQETQPASITGAWEWQDGVQQAWGDDADALQWWDNSTGTLYTKIQTDASTWEIQVDDSGDVTRTQIVVASTAVGLGYLGSTKLVTTATGVDISGALTLDTQLAVAEGGTGATSFTPLEFLWYSGTAVQASGFDMTSFASPSHTHSNYVRTDADTDVSANTEWQDDYSAYFGNDGDLRIWWDGPDVAAYIDVVTQDKSLTIRTTDAGGIQSQAVFSQTAVSLSYDGNTKLQTTATGIDVTGTIVMDTPLAIAEGGTGATDFTDDKFLWETGGVVAASTYDQNSFAASVHTHPAGEVLSGTFEAGNYTFPDDVWINNLYSTNLIQIQNSLTVLDDNTLWFGSSSDAGIFWDTSPSEILTLKVYNWDEPFHIICTESAGDHLAAVFTPQTQELYFDASKKFETTTGGAKITGTLEETSQHTHSGYISAGDNVDITGAWEWQDGVQQAWGADGDAKMWWDNAGILYTRVLTDAATWNLQMDDSGDTTRTQIVITSTAVSLSHTGSTKLATTATGVDISGALTLDTQLAIAEGGTGATSFASPLEFLWYSGTAIQASGYDITSFASPSHTHSNYVRTDADTNVSANTEWQDDYSAFFGDWWDGPDVGAYIDVVTLNKALTIRTTDGGGIQSQAVFSQTAVSLAYDGSTKLATTTTGVDISGALTLDTALAVAEGGTANTSFNALDFLWFSGTSIQASGYDQNSWAAVSHTHSNYVRTDANTNVSADTEWQDDYSAYFGNDGDLRIWWDGPAVAAYIDVITQDKSLTIRTTDGVGIQSQAVFSQTAVSLSYDGNTKLATTNTGINITGTIGAGTWGADAIGTSYGGAPSGGTTGQVLKKIDNTSYNYSWQNESVGDHEHATIDADWEWQDDISAYFGNDGDLRVWWDGPDVAAYIDVIRQDKSLTIRTTDAGGIQSQAVFSQTAVSLSYDGSTKLATTATGVDITGTLDATTLQEGSADIDTLYLGISATATNSSQLEGSNKAAVQNHAPQSHAYDTHTGSVPWAEVSKTSSDLADLASRAISSTTGTLAVSRGGTGATNFTDNQFLWETGGVLAASGYSNSSFLGASAQAVDSAKLENNTLAQVQSHAPASHAITSHTGLPLLVANGGTGTTSFTEGYVVYYSGGEIVNWKYYTDIAIRNATTTVSSVWTYTAIPAFNGGTTGSTAPFTVDSTYKVANLNADYLDGYTEASFPRLGAANSFTATNTFRHVQITAGYSLGFNGGVSTRFYYNSGQIRYDDNSTNDANIASVKAITATATAPTGDYPWGALHVIY